MYYLKPKSKEGCERQANAILQSYLVGTLSEHGEPETAESQMQDWGVPWLAFRPLSRSQSGDDGPYIDGDYQETLLTFARCFYFGD